MTNSNILKRTLFLLTQLVLLAVAAICLYYAHDNFTIRSIGLLAIFVSVALVRRSRALPASSEVRAMQSAWALKPWHWVVGLALAVSVAVTLVWLFQDATTGYKDVAPVYAFAVAGLVCAGWWAGLIARWLNR
jgi:hypothetical protein